MQQILGTSPPRQPSLPASTSTDTAGFSRTNAYLEERRSWRWPPRRSRSRPQGAMEQFLEWRAWLAKATSPMFVDGLIAIVVAGAITELLQLIFS